MVEPTHACAPKLPRGVDLSYSARIQWWAAKSLHACCSSFQSFPESFSLILRRSDSLQERGPGDTLLFQQFNMRRCLADNHRKRGHHSLKVYSIWGINHYAPSCFNWQFVHHGPNALSYLMGRCLIFLPHCLPRLEESVPGTEGYLVWTFRLAISVNLLFYSRLPRYVCRIHTTTSECNVHVAGASLTTAKSK